MTFIITGANCGLAWKTAEDLASKKARLILACRSEAKGVEAAQRLRTIYKNEEVTFRHLDLASLASVRRFADEVKSELEVLDGLVLNAGLFVPPDKCAKTRDGYEIHFGVNHLGHFLLAQLLRDLLAKSESGRIVTVSSSLSNQGQISLKDKETFMFHGRKPASSREGRMNPAYCDSKLMNALFSQELAKRVPGNVSAYCVCPGWCYTNLFRYSDVSLLKKIAFSPIAFLFMRSEGRGAENILHVLLEDKEKLHNGGFYRECAIAEKESARWKSLEEEGRQLWELSEQLTKE